MKKSMKRVLFSIVFTIFLMATVVFMYYLTERVAIVCTAMLLMVMFYKFCGYVFDWLVKADTPPKPVKVTKRKIDEV